MFNVIKRDGEVAAFQLSKITQAIRESVPGAGKTVYAGYDGDARTAGNCGFPE